MMDLNAIILALLITLIILHLLPRPYIRRLRKAASDFTFWQWKRMSKLSAVIYCWLHERMNGNNGD